MDLSFDFPESKKNYINSMSHRPEHAVSKWPQGTWPGAG